MTNKWVDIPWALSASLSPFENVCHRSSHIFHDSSWASNDCWVTRTRCKASWCVTHEFGSMLSRAHLRENLGLIPRVRSEWTAVWDCHYSRANNIRSIDTFPSSLRIILLKVSECDAIGNGGRLMLVLTVPGWGSWCDKDSWIPWLHSRRIGLSKLSQLRLRSLECGLALSLSSEILLSWESCMSLSGSLPDPLKLCNTW